MAPQVLIIVTASGSYPEYAISVMKPGGGASTMRLKLTGVGRPQNWGIKGAGLYNVTEDSFR